MFPNNQEPIRPKKPYYFQDRQGNVYRSVFVGYHLDTGEQYAVLREISNGRIWVIPKQRLYSGCIQNGQYVQEFKELHNFNDPYYNNTKHTPELSYPGFVDDPRSTINARGYGRQMRGDDFR